MMYAFITLVLGIVIGSVVSRRLVTQRWAGRLESSKAEFAYDLQQLTYELGIQTDDLGAKNDELGFQTDQIQQLQDQMLESEQECDRLKAAQQLAQAEASSALRQAKQAYENALEEKEREYNSRLNDERTKFLRLQIEHNKHRENITASLQATQEVEKQNGQLSYKNTYLEERLKTLEETLDQQKKQHESVLQAAYEEPDLDLAKVVEKVFPTVELLYHSIDELKKHKQDFGSILSEIQTIVTHGHHTRANKLRGTRADWWECRIGQQGRIYYLKINSETTPYKVVIAWKANRQTQNKVIDWLKKQHYWRESS